MLIFVTYILLFVSEIHNYYIVSTFFIYCHVIFAVPSLPRTMIQLSEQGSSQDDEGGFTAFDDQRSVRQSTRSQRSQHSQRSHRLPIRGTLQRNGAIGGYAK